MSAAPGDALAAEPTGAFESLTSMFFGSAAAGVTANVDAAPKQNADLGIKQASNWKPETKLADNKVATGVVQSNNTATAMGAEAKEGLANIADIEKNMNEQAAPDAKAGGANAASLTGMGKGLMFDAAVVGTAGLLAGPGAAAAMGGVMMARDALKAVSGGSNDPRMAQGPSPKSVTLKGQEARDAERGHLPEEVRKAQYGPSNSFEQQARQHEGGTGYNRTSVTNSMFKDLAKGPGFGPEVPTGDSDLGARTQIASDGLSGIEQIKLAKAGFENQLHTAQDLKDGLAARANNGVEVTNAADLGDLKARDFQMTASAKAVLIPGAVA